MSKLLLVRHGQSEWNSQNKFTGWVDVELSPVGKAEAKKSGEIIKSLNLKIDYYYTSFLKRAINTLEIILENSGSRNKSYVKSWELNERHYGALTGLNKDQVKKKIGDEQFKIYRRSWDQPPPAIESDNENLTLFSDLNSMIPAQSIPKTESLKDTFNRAVPFYKMEIETKLKNNHNILIAAHGNSIRALCKEILQISDIKINELEIPTGNPLLINFDNKMVIDQIKYLDKERAKKIIFNT